jgi:hypothetical protein
MWGSMRAIKRPAVSRQGTGAGSDREGATRPDAVPRRGDTGASSAKPRHRRRSRTSAQHRGTWRGTGGRVRMETC